ncbi:hypothetical protein [Acrocarpospora catenulata]|uniref:hypothetical protein n=1 Tax=Acrocarpospora catenulata TaxID=2836182 RepID=UPI001BDA425A|nr:hypothetical protein [Acrocarpospora catenulata]
MLILAAGPAAICALSGMAIAGYLRLDATTAHGLYLTITALVIATGAAWAAYRNGDITDPEDHDTGDTNLAPAPDPYAWTSPRI